MSYYRERSNTSEHGAIIFRCSLGWPGAGLLAVRPCLRGHLIRLALIDISRVLPQMVTSRITGCANEGSSSFFFFFFLVEQGTGIADKVSIPVPLSASVGLLVLSSPLGEMHYARLG
jgi:hypothetical protein